jgi:CRISPR-associated protein Csm4
MLHSDSIYSAIISAWATLGLAIPDDLTTNDLGFTISSLFPFYQKGKEENSMYFFPKPLGIIQPKNYDDHKPIKKIKYLDLPSFQDVLTGDFKAEVNNIKGDFYLKNKKQDFDKDFMQSEVYARNTVAREEGKDTQIYYIDRIFFKGNSGLFCVAQFDDKKYPDIENKVMGALRYLQDEGIGTDRHVGNGLFELEIIDFKGFEANNNQDYALNLSLFCPKDKDGFGEMLDENTKYEITKRGGWISTEPYLSYRKKSVYMFKEGSIFKTDAESKGKTVDLKPENTPKEVNHSVYRVGKSLFVPIKL